MIIKPKKGWQLANAVTNSGNSLIINTNLISKMYFLRLIAPLTPVLAGLLDFSIASIVFNWYDVFIFKKHL